jgi:hypothetical protein
MRKSWITGGLCIASCLAAFATEPAQPTAFGYGSLKPYSFSISFTGSGADGYLVLRSNSPVTAVPVDGVTYEKGGGVNGTKVFSVGSSTFVPIKEVHAGTTYYFAIFAYNGSGAGIDYKQANPLTGSVTTTDNQVGSYYSGLDQNATTFIADLKNRVNTGKIFVPYGNYASNIAPGFFEHDTVGGKKYVQCEYSHEIKQYTAPFTFVGINYSREHSLCKSWMLTGGSTSSAEGSDYHNLYLTNLNDVNSPRSNYPYGEVVSNADSYLAFTMGDNSNGDRVCEPAPDIKGDVARSQFYMIICYNGVGGGSWAYNNLSSNGPDQNVDVLLNWHYADPPDGKEKAKHEYIYFLQNNRNPFIDNPEWVDCINFRTLTRYAGCTYTTGIEDEYDNLMVNAWPNPATNELHVLLQKVFPGTTLRLVSMSGQVVYETLIDVTAEDYQHIIPVQGISSGMYVVQTESQHYQSKQKIMIQN